MISTVTATMTTVTMTQVMDYSMIAAIALITFLAIKEILSSETNKNERMKSFVNGSNVAIGPLLCVFVAIVTYKIVTVL
ncbi:MULTISPECIES: hypothetical protein [Methanobacterium]|uniref:DUF350 domain-containing protein n=1 Tax=Methanobacterium veterum TaxID=408577 RepID=A0A9E4ZY27_9EURY|nr:MULTISPECIES: hypothetical protein [Methanobacterium]MCZ3367504.1 hypothetical protein [Methanobacterium veterum]MCZ3373348.1 hypothetical protein [Methanobacterium veterum]